MEENDIEFTKKVGAVLCEMERRYKIRPLHPGILNGYDAADECDGVMGRAGTDGSLMINDNTYPFCDDEDRKGIIALFAADGSKKKRESSRDDVNEVLKFRGLYVSPTEEGQAVHEMGHLLEYSRVKKALLYNKARKLYGKRAAKATFGDVTSTDEWGLMKQIEETYEASLLDGSIYALSECASFSPEEFFAESFVSYHFRRNETPEAAIALVTAVEDFRPGYLGARPMHGE